jgi:WD40 repeat protein
MQPNPAPTAGLEPTSKTATPLGDITARPSSPKRGVGLQAEGARGLLKQSVKTQVGQQLGICEIKFKPDGSAVALRCMITSLSLCKKLTFSLAGEDGSVQVWSTRTHNIVQVAQIDDLKPILSIDWMHGDEGVIMLAEKGIIQKCALVSQSSFARSHGFQYLLSHRLAVFVPTQT